MTGATGGAGLEVTQPVLGGSYPPLAGEQQLRADRAAVGVARRARLDEVQTRPRDELLRRRDADLELRGHLLEAQAVELARDERLPLACR